MPFVITSNRAVDEWLSLFDDPILGNGALERLANASYQIVIEVARYRERLSPHRALQAPTEVIDQPNYNLIFVTSPRFQGGSITAEIDTMLTMVKDGNWFRLAHRHLFSMAFYRARPGVNTMKQDALRAAVGQCSERWRRPRVVSRWSGRLGVGLRAFQELHPHFTGSLQ